MAEHFLVEWFDGRRPVAREARVWLDATELHVAPSDGSAPFSVPRASVTWPERQRHGQRQVLLPGGGVLVAHDGPAWDAFLRASGHGESAVVRAQQSWRAAMLALLLLVATVFALWRWGVPLAAEAGARWLPARMEQQLGDVVMDSVEGDLVSESSVPQAEQDALRARFKALVARSYSAQEMPAHELLFRAGNDDLGPNAFALPGGRIVLTDALYGLLKDEPDALLGVLAHELGHVHHRHGLRSLLQLGATAAVSSLVMGDFTVLLSAAPALLAQMGYSRAAEREADAHALAVMQQGGLDPAKMAVFFERIEVWLREEHPDALDLPIAISTHPAGPERVAFFKGQMRGQ